MLQGVLSKYIIKLFKTRKDKTNKILSKFERLIIKVVKIFNRKKYNELFYLHIKHLGVNLNGKPRFIEDNVYFDPVDYTKISRNVTFLVHDYSISRPFVLHDNAYLGGIKPIQLKKGCFIGASTTILPGTTVGVNTIIGTGSVIKGNIPDNVVVAGNPARVIKDIDEYYLKMKESESDNIRLWKIRGEKINE